MYNKSLRYVLTFSFTYEETEKKRLNNLLKVKDLIKEENEKYTLHIVNIVMSNSYSVILIYSY